MQVPNAVSSNPNASVTALAGAVTILFVWIVGVAGLSVPAEVGSALTTIVAGVILWLGPPGRRDQPNPLTPGVAPASVGEAQ
jgi:hypothetical protein